MPRILSWTQWLLTLGIPTCSCVFKTQIPTWSWWLRTWVLKTRTINKCGTVGFVCGQVCTTCPAVPYIKSNVYREAEACRWATLRHVYTSPVPCCVVTDREVQNNQLHVFLVVGIRRSFLYCRGQLETLKSSLYHSWNLNGFRKL